MVAIPKLNAGTTLLKIHFLSLSLSHSLARSLLRFVFGLSRFGLSFLSRCPDGFVRNRSHTKKASVESPFHFVTLNFINFMRLFLWVSVIFRPQCDCCWFSAVYQQVCAAACSILGQCHIAMCCAVLCSYRAYWCLPIFPSTVFEFQVVIHKFIPMLRVAGVAYIRHTPMHSLPHHETFSHSRLYSSHKQCDINFVFFVSTPFFVVRFFCSAKCGKIDWRLWLFHTLAKYIKQTHRIEQFTIRNLWNAMAIPS